MKLSQFLFEKNEDPNQLVLILRDYLTGNATKEEVMEVIPQIKEIKGNGALLEFENYWDLFSQDANTQDYIGMILGDSSYIGSFVYDDQESDDWDNAYGFYNFTQDQKNRVNNIMSFIYPELRDEPCDFDSDSDCTKNISTFISEEFYSELRDILDYITESRNEEAQEKLKEELLSDYSLPLPKKLLQMMVIEPYKSFVLTLPQLLNFVERHNDGSDNLEEIIKEYNYQNNYYPDYEDGFSDYTDSFDQEGLQKYVNKLLDVMEESIMDNAGPFSKYSKVNEYYTLLKRFNITVGKLNKFPEDSIYSSFRVTRFLPEENKVIIQVIKKPNMFSFLNYKLPLDGVQNLLTTYSLF